MPGQDDMPQGRLTRAFFARPVLQVAPELLGCTVSHSGVTVRLTEVEAYDGSNDPGSHAFRGPTPRTRVMFGESGDCMSTSRMGCIGARTWSAVR